MRQLISISEFQEIYGVSRSTVYRLAQRGKFPLVKIGQATRIPTEDAEKWFRGLPRAAVTP